ncbi:MAG TPA: ATP-dependent DNA helicase [Microbacteriaceae bacterium]|nr:ATP-dependent DNA helicase [Microbacteriaceae bacterium]
MNKMIFSPVSIANILKEPGKEPLLPTAEQRSVIESSLNNATLVVAGAGSGKTETIANRVVWLVANGFAEPGEILGLTFTRKAAGELSERVRNRLITFTENAVKAGQKDLLSTQQRESVGRLQDTLHNSMELPEISTYNSFAVSIFQEFGAAAGFSSDAKLIDNASAWNLAREIVISATDADLVNNDFNLNTLISMVLNLDRSVHENLSSFIEARKQIENFMSVLDLPRDEKVVQGKKEHSNYADLSTYVSDIEKTLLYSRLAESYADQKMARGLLEYSDQVSLALATLKVSPLAIRILRKRSKFILLDEVQDTSVAQTTLLAKIFAGSSVMGVGDPHQSIYGWRGASSESISGFHSAFNSLSAKHKKQVLTLTTSWRNAKQILKVANTVAQPLQEESAFQVPQLSTPPGARNGTVETHYFETLHQEAESVAEWLSKKRNTFECEHSTAPTSAIIFRMRKHMNVFAEELAKKSIPYKIVGLGGLLSTPEVADIVSVLRVLWFVDAGSELIRVLSGPRFAIGIADISGLRDYAQFLDRKYQKQIQPDQVLARQSVTIIDALDRLLSNSDSAILKTLISAEGITRMKLAGEMFRRLRKLIGGDLLDLISEIELELMLDLELEVRSSSRGSTKAQSRSNIYAFIGEVRNFLTTTETADLRTLLLWLEKSQEEDNLTESVPPASGDEVQLITIHSAKGLEWDLVAVPRLSVGEFPAAPKSVKGWLRAGELPDECRGDKATRPKLFWQDAKTQQEVRERINDYSTQLRAEHDLEERRLAYVAVTRAKKDLFLSGTFWAKTKKPSIPSPILKETIANFENRSLPDASEFNELPENENSQKLIWPYDPLGVRRPAVEQAALLVKSKQKLNLSIDDVANPYIKILLADAKNNNHIKQPTRLPERMNASGFQEYINDPVKALLQFTRPVPKKPFREARIGNIFHEWVERRTTTALGTALELDLEQFKFEQNIEETEDQKALDDLITNFEKSRWSEYNPLAVELEIALPFAGRRIICKLDAVYEIENEIEIIDWKTGRPPKTKKEQEQRFLQLDLYRHAYAMYAGISAEKIEAILFYVSTNETIELNKKKTLEELEEMWLKSVQNNNR